MESIFANPLEELIEFGDMNRELERGQGPLLVSGCMDSQKAHLISELTKEIPWKLIVTYAGAAYTVGDAGWPARADVHHICHQSKG